MVSAVRGRTMRVAFRADSNLQLGRGHLARCHALADELCALGIECTFICRDIPSPLVTQLQEAGHRIEKLVGVAARTGDGGNSSGEEDDAKETLEVIQRRGITAMVVDHYSLGLTWEVSMRQAGLGVLAIDDLGRGHASDLVLDQNFANPVHAKYRERFLGDGASPTLLLGPSYALVRPEFARLRPDALKRPRGLPTRWLLFMSGSDATDETSKALCGIVDAFHPSWRVDVVIGSGHPRRREIMSICMSQPNVRLHVDTRRMAELMAEADCAVGAGGSATWERCVLGLPAIVTVLAENQVEIAKAVSLAGAQVLLPPGTSTTPETYTDACMRMSKTDLAGMSAAAAAICDGLGAPRVAQYLVEALHHA